MTALQIQWSTMKTVVARDSFSLYYVSVPQGTSPETYSYNIIGTNQVYFYITWANIGTDGTDFENNYKSAAISVLSQDDAFALAVPAISTEYMPSQIWQENDVSTTGLSKTTVVSYTVATGFNFYIMGHTLTRVTDNGTEALPATLEVFSGGSTVYKIERNLGSGGDSNWEKEYPFPLKVASSTDIIKLTVTPTSLLSTSWSGRITGFLRSQ